MLPAPDRDFLERKGFRYEVKPDAGMICVIIPGLKLPPGLVPAQSDLMYRLATGYPDIPPDMWWFYPAVRRADGVPIPATDSIEQHFDRAWQRWSRHLDPGTWLAGVDTLESFFALTMKELAVNARTAA